MLVRLFIKSKNRGNFAAILTCNLFDEAILAKSNVQGRHKEMLDPEIIKFVKTKCFHFSPQKMTKKVNGKSVLRASMISTKPLKAPDK